MQRLTPRGLTAGSILVLIFVLESHGVEACTCAPYPDDLEKAVAMAYAQADVIFLGDVTSIRNLRFRALPQREARFVVHDRWKGSVSDATVVRTNDGEIACGYDFHKGRSYLVFAYWDPDHTLLTTSFCDLTRTEAEAKEVIVILNRLGKPLQSTN